MANTRLSSLQLQYKQKTMAWNYSITHFFTKKNKPVVKIIQEASPIFVCILSYHRTLS